MNEDRFKVRVTVYVLFIKDNKILLYRRTNTDWQNGKYNFPGGHLEENESVIEAAAREALEESGLTVNPSNLKLIHVMHRLPIDGKPIETNRNIIDLFFKATTWTGEPQITEENKSDNLIWADLNNLPDDLLKFEREALNQIKNNNLISVFSG